MSETKKLIPKRRFKEFQNAGEWEQREFKDDIVSIQTGTNLLGSTSNRGRPLLKMGNIQRGYFSLDKLEKLSENTEVEPENIANYGDFLFNTRNTLELVGKGATWVGVSGVYAFNSNLARFVFKNIDTVFFNYLYNTIHMIKQINQRAMGTTSVAAVYPKSLNSVKYRVPLLPEQKKCGEFLISLDNLITLHERKLEKIRSMKKAYLYEMFPAEGESKPKRRFKGFTDDWETCNLGDVYKFQYGQFNNNPSNGGKYPVYGANGIIGGYTEFNAESSVIIGHMGEYAGIVLWHEGKHFVTYNGIISTPKNNKIYDKYGYHMLCKKDIRRICGGSGQPFLSYEMLNKLSCSFPVDVAEQIKINELFTNLNTLITLHQSKLDKLKNLKKAYLNEMFI